MKRFRKEKLLCVKIAVIVSINPWGYPVLDRMENTNRIGIAGTGASGWGTHLANASNMLKNNP